MLPSLEITQWKEESLSALAEKILKIAPRPLVLVDGKGGSGKTSFAVKLAAILNANLVSTDDVAWWLDPIHWDDELLNGIILPWLDEKNVEYTPSGWLKKNREGFIAVAPSKPLVIEGCGACRKNLRELATYSVWIDTDPILARERVIQRDLAAGENGGTLESVTKSTDWFDSIIDPFLLEEQAWKHVNLIVSGTSSDLSYGSITVSGGLQ